MRRATDYAKYYIRGREISIHALLAESDQAANGFAHAPPKISIHALLAESDQTAYFFLAARTEFLSTLSLRRATRQHSKPDSGRMNFYPRSPCGERRWIHPVQPTASRFLSTLSLRRATDFAGSAWVPEFPFLSTLSLRRATADKAKTSNADIYFYPRSPCGERPV